MIIDYTSKIKHWNTRKSAISKIVLHNTDSTAAIAVGWFMSDKSMVSAHYIVNRDGHVLACVKEENNAWHAGVAEVNHKSIGIELEADFEHQGMTKEQELSLLDMLKELFTKYKLSKEDILLHRQVKATSCPGYIFPTDASFNLWMKINLK